MSDEDLQQPLDSGIAIIGMTCRFPGAPSVAAFWHNLSAGVESIAFFDQQELLDAGVSPQLIANPNYVPARGVLADIDLFDARFFGFTQREAEILDPQQRLFLECVWEALEHAGYNPDIYPGSIGVYGGTSASTYLYNLQANPEIRDLVGSFQLMLGNNQDYLTTRASYKLNLQGPSVNVQTACSTSLVAVHQGCQSLLNYQCDLALAGGVTITVPHRAGYLYQAGGIMSSDGHCRAFDAQSEGFVGGNGVGVVVLKRLAEALADGDLIHAVIKGSAINNDGALKIGFTAPSEEGQAAVIALAQAIAEVEPETISYIEAHGTGTALGDPIELAALNQVFQAATDQRAFCAIGSVKTNIGHLDAAAGVAGLIKAVLALSHQQIPPSLHYTRPNPKFDFASSAFYVNQKLIPWETGGVPRRAGVSSFGIGGTNAHVVLEEAPEREASGPARPWQLLVLSARTSPALDTATANLIQDLKQHPGRSLADVAYTLQVGRKAFSQRRFVVCHSVEDAIQALESEDPKRVFSAVQERRERPVAFMFPGQGSQHMYMAADLYQQEAVFREVVDSCAELLLAQLGRDLRSVIFPPAAQAEAAERDLTQTHMTQPALFVIEYGLARLWMAWGVQPAQMIGHSIGEYVAACLAGVMELPDALALVAARSRLMQDLPPGTMLAVPLAESEVRQLLADDLDLAVINEAGRCVVSGPTAAIDDLQALLAARNVESRRLHTSHAFHSRMLDPILEDFTQRVRQTTLSAPQIPYLSNVTGTWITAAQATSPEYWATQMRQAVRFADGINVLCANPAQILLEVGPGQTLTSLAKRSPQRAAEHQVLASLRHPQDAQPDSPYVFTVLGRLWLGGVNIDWAAFSAHEWRRRVAVPTYPFERRRYWIDPAPTSVQLEIATPIPAEASMSVQAPISVRHQHIEATLKTLVGRFTGLAINEVESHDSWLETGFDSLLLIQFNHAIQDEFGVKISLIQLIEEFPTPGTMAAYLDAVLPPEVARPLESVGPAQPQVQPAAFQPSPQVQPAAFQPPPQTYTGPLAPAPAASSSFADPGAAASVERIMVQQLQLMAQQLDVLRTGGAAQASPTQSSPAPQASPIAPSSASAPPALNLAATQSSPAGGVAAADSRVIASVPYVPYRPVETIVPAGMTTQQKEYLAGFIQRYNARTRESKRMTQHYRPVLADSRSTAVFKLQWKELIYPIIGRSSLHSKLWDIDGNEYVDVTMGFGVHLFGHSPRFIMDAMEAQMKQGIQLGPQSLIAGQVAELFCELTGMDRVNFCNSGTEAVLGAIRIARTVTRRTKIAIFTGSYHGWSDTTLVRALAVDGQHSSMPMAPGVSARTAEDVLVLEYGSPESLNILAAHMHELAAVLVEPIQSRRPEFQPKAFLQALRELTAQGGAALIFDEMICGFRAHPAGAQGWFGIQADIGTYGKVFAGGLPVGAVAGKAVWMDAFDGGMWNYGDGSYPEAEKTLFAGAFFKHPLTMAASFAVLNHLKMQGPALQEQLNQRTTQLVERLNAYFEAEEVPIHTVHFSSLFRFNLHPSVKFLDLFYYHLTEQGLYNWEGGNCFLATCHTAEDLEAIVQAVKASVADLRSGGFLPPAPKRGGHSESGANGGQVEQPLVAVQSGAVTSQRTAATEPGGRQAVQFSVYYFGSYDAPFDPHKYDLVFAGARFADQHGFSAVWLPERHFHSFGGISPNPAVIAAALARETTSIQIRAGSVALPLHHPIRVAEEWSMVDNLSRGRVGISFASGWHPDDFVFAPAAYPRRREAMMEGIETVRTLWRGGKVAARGGAGTDLDVALFPMPMQPELPVWLTCANSATFIKAGEMGVSVLTNLQDQTVEELAEKIARYRTALASHGHAPEVGHVTVLLHTFVSASYEQAVETARQPFYQYLKSSLKLAGNKEQAQSNPLELERVSDEDLNYLFREAYERYLRNSSLIGSPETCAATIDRLVASGVDEIGCFIDFGVPSTVVVSNFPHLNALKNRYVRPPDAPPGLTLPLTQAQQGLWVLAQLDAAASAIYNESVTLQLHGELDVPSLHQAFTAVVQRHDSLRTTFSPTGQTQHVAPRLRFDLPLIDLTALEPAAREARVAAFIAEDLQQPFDLAQGPLFRLQLLKLAPTTHLLIFTIHHIVTDGRSIGIILQETTALYSSLRQGLKPELPTPLQFKDYIAWLEQQRAGDSESYWLNQFAGAVPVLELPIDYPRPVVQTYSGTQCYALISQELTHNLRALAARQGSTLFMTVLAAFNVLLHRLSGQSDLVVGFPASGQSLMGDPSLTGYCLNLLPLRSNVAANPTFTQYVQTVKRTLLHAFSHQNYSLTTLLEKLNLPRDPARPPLISVVINLEKIGSPPAMFGMQVEANSNPRSFSRVDMSLNVVEHEHELRLEWDYNTDLFATETIQRWIGHFQTLLAGAAHNPTLRLSDLPLLSPAELQTVLDTFNATARPNPAGSIPELFAAQVQRTPQALAVSCRDQQLTYRELDQRSNQLARHLQSLGVGPEVPVGLYMERSLEFIVGLWGILKAGGGYVPLDPTYPAERLAFMIGDTGLNVLLTQRTLGPTLLQLECQIIELDTEWKTISSHADSPLTEQINPDQLAYIIYTSGSTGTPKGVMITHRAINNTLFNRQASYPLTSADRVLQTISCSFDAAVWECFAPFLVGAHLDMSLPHVRQAGAELAPLIKSRGITTLQLPPPWAQALLDEPDAAGCVSLKRLFCGGQILPVDLQQRWFATLDASLHNLYGPTEAAIDTTIWDCSAAGPPGAIPIGYPIANTQVYILDQQGQPVGLGVTGELQIGGIGLARGYLGQPGLTAEQFVPNPFSATPGSRLYKTGDLARHRPDGAIEYLGRLDDQVKIRGFRIEIGEIEASLRRHAAVRDVAVLAREDVPGQTRLVAYVVPDSAQPPTPGELRALLKTALPEHMIPAVFMLLDELPLTSNGKTDRQALPAPAPSDSASLVMPRTPLEETLAQIWSEMLKLDQLGVYDNFFELGGHSLLGTQVISRVRDMFQVDLAFRHLLAAPTIADLALLIDQHERGPSIPAIRRVSQGAEEQLLASIDQLGDQEVDSLLADLLAAASEDGSL